jgi:hypothetical protein
MNILGMGLDLAGKPLFNPIAEKDFVGSLLSTLSANAKTLQSIAKFTSEAVVFRAEVERTVLDSGDPRAVGWTYLVNANDPLRQDIEEILEPLAKHRGMPDLEAPLLYNREPPEQWLDWLHSYYFALGLGGIQVPRYILIAGGPDQVPFRFQSLLSSLASVGRVNFNNTEDLKNYVSKLIRIETAQNPIVERDVIVFAPDGGPADPTYFSRRYMAKPLAEHIVDHFRIPTHILLGGDATKENLFKALRSKKPALVYTASHGLGARNQPLEVQKRLNGAICCQCNGRLTLGDLFTDS